MYYNLDKLSSGENKNARVEKEIFVFSFDNTFYFFLKFKIKFFLIF